MVPLRHGRGRRRPQIAGAVSALALAISGAALADRAASLELVYAPAAGADAIYDAGVTAALRQGRSSTTRAGPAPASSRRSAARASRA